MVSQQVSSRLREFLALALLVVPAAAFADGRLLVFGGRTAGARLNDLWAFDTATFRWEQLPVQGTAPSPRQGAAACVHEGQLWVVGGSSNFVLDDVFTYSLQAQARGAGTLVLLQPQPQPAVAAAAQQRHTALPHP